ncbi:PhoH family protein [Planctomycetota bacterium]
MTAGKKIIRIDDPIQEKVLGIFDKHIKQIKKQCDISISTRGASIHISGDEENVSRGAEVIQKCISRVSEGKQVTEAFLDSVLSHNQEGAAFVDLDIYPRTKGQGEYLEAIEAHDIVFVTGPAGTGKTYLAVASAVNALMNHKVKKIVLVRPAVEAGEKLGFLPGDMREKVNPYLIPVYDALYDMLSYDKTKAYMERGIIEVIPIAFMRGRTFHSSFIVMDEGQNTSKGQMLMFLTRMGVGSDVIVTGDITQIDLPQGEPSGLLHALSVLKNIKGIGFVELKRSDIVRHSLVKKIVRYYTIDNGQ